MRGRNKQYIEAIVHGNLLACIMCISVCWGAAANAAQNAVFTATASGVTNSLSITASLGVRDADAGQNGNIYLVAKTNNAWFAHNGASWVRWIMGPIPVYSSGILTSRSIEVARNLDASALIGTQILLGYGLNEADMLSNEKYGLVYTLLEPVPVARSNLQRVAAPQVSDNDKAALVSGNTDFAIGLYRKLLSDPAQGQGNIFFSPHSISVALAMTYAGARSGTASEIANALHFTLPQEKLHPAFDWLDLELMSRGQGAQGKDGQPFRLKISNSIWGDSVSQFEMPFLDTLAQYYDAGINRVDFRAAPEPSRIRINDWVAGKTEQRILNLIPPGAVDASTRMVLVNAIYFNAAWQNKFRKDWTTKASFTRLDGSSSQVDMMRKDVTLRYAAGADYQAVELPYDGNELSMIVVLPAAGRFNQFEQSFGTAPLNSIVAALGYQYIHLGLPKFRVESFFNLKAAMQALGMQAAFNPASADFSGISTRDQHFIQDIFHKSFAEIDENGTEAAAATAVMIGPTSAPQSPNLSFVADRPFLFAIMDKKTGAVVFYGRVVDPKR